MAKRTEANKKNFIQFFEIVSPFLQLHRIIFSTSDTIISLKKKSSKIFTCAIYREYQVFELPLFFFWVSVMAWKDSIAKILWIPTKNYWKNPLHLNTPTRYSYEKSKNKLLFKFALFNQSIYAYFYIFFLTKLKYFLKDMTNSFYVLTNALFFM